MSHGVAPSAARSLYPSSGEAASALTCAGVRDDNRIENLELWTTSHPPGQRVADVVDWAKDILETYG